MVKNPGCRFYFVPEGRSKLSPTKEILGTDIDRYKMWIEYQMTPDLNWSIIETDHVKPFCIFDVSKDEELREAFNWKNTQPLLKQDRQHKGTKYNFLDYQLHFIEAYQFIKLNDQKGLYQDFC